MVLKVPAVPLGHVIATRTMHVGPKMTPVTLAIGAPVHVGKGWDWACPYRIAGLGRVIKGRAFGVDAVQAVQLVSLALREDLEKTGKKLTFLGHEFWQFGFPKQVVAFNDPDLEQRLTRVLDLEIAKWTSRLKRTRRRARKTTPE
jgi:hypothetical protein